MNMTVLQNIISEVGKCPLCLNPIILQADLKNKYGFSFKLILLCSILVVVILTDLIAIGAQVIIRLFKLIIKTHQVEKQS